MKSRIHYTKPSITELEIKYATDAATNGWGEKCYEYIHRFEAAFKDHLGVNYAIATSSCTGALHMGMAALGIGPGDEVIMLIPTGLRQRPLLLTWAPNQFLLMSLKVAGALTLKRLRLLLPLKPRQYLQSICTAIFAR